MRRQIAVPASAVPPSASCLDHYAFSANRLPRRTPAAVTALCRPINQIRHHRAPADRTSIYVPVSALFPSIPPNSNVLLFLPPSAPQSSTRLGSHEIGSMRMIASRRAWSANGGHFRHVCVCVCVYVCDHHSQTLPHPSPV